MVSWGRGFYGQGGDPVQSALGMIGERHQRDEQLQGEELQRQIYLVSKLIESNPAHAAEILSQNPKLAGLVSYDASKFQQTPEEKFGGMVTQSNIDTFPTLPQSTKQAGTYQAGFHAPMPKEQVDALTAQDVYANKGKWAPEMQGRQLVADNIAPTGNTRLTVGETNRHNIVEEGQTGPLRIAQGGAANANAVESYSSAAEHKAKTKGIEATNGLLFNPVGGSPSPSNGAPLTDADLASAPPIVEQIVKRSYNPMLLRRLSVPEQEAILGRVRQYDPSFNLNDYEQQVTTKKGFATGPPGQAVNSLNTVIGHIDQLRQDWGKLSNGDFPAYNAVANEAGRQFGNKGIQESYGRVQQDADAVASEFAKIMKGSGQTNQHEIEEWRKNFNPNAAPAEQKAAIDTAIKLAASRLAALDDQYNKGVGRSRDFRILNDHSDTILKGMGYDPSAIDGVAGKSSKAPSPSPKPSGAHLKWNVQTQAFE